MVNYRNALDTLVESARAGEAVIAAAQLLTLSTKALVRLVEIEPALEPEITAALEKVEEAVSALASAKDVIAAKLDNAKEEMNR